jgi:hypothetical protein
MVWGKQFMSGELLQLKNATLIGRTESAEIHEDDMTLTQCVRERWTPGILPTEDLAVPPHPNSFASSVEYWVF